MLETADARTMGDLAALGLALMVIGWMSVHIRDYRILLKKVEEMEKEIRKQEARYQDQKVRDVDFFQRLVHIDDTHETLRDELRLISKMIVDIQVQVASHFKNADK